MRASAFSSVKREARGERAVVATKHRLASAAGLEMLRSGGNVVDAAVAAAFAVGVVEPSSSGIGGGGYLVYQVGERAGAFGFSDARAARSDPRHVPADRRARGRRVRMAGGRGTTPTWRGPARSPLREPSPASRQRTESWGGLPLDEVIAPAVELARVGFAPEFHDLMAFGQQAGKLTRHAELRRVFLRNGELPHGVRIPGPGYQRGEPVRAEPAMIRQPELAETLAEIAIGGAAGFYRGGIAKRLVDAVQAGGGVLCLADLASYRPFHWQAGGPGDGPLEVRYRNLRVRVAPFASGGITSAMTLQLLAGADLAACGHNSAEALHRYICAARLAYADRFAFLADPESADVPWHGLTSPAYAARRWAAVGRKAPRHFKAGDPWQEEGAPCPAAPARQRTRLSGRHHPPVRDGRRRQRGLAHQHADGRVRVGGGGTRNGRDSQQRHDVVRSGAGPCQLDRARASCH